MITGANLIELSQVIVGDRMRVDLGEIEELAESIKLFGLLQPILLDEQHRLIAGGRRYTAFTLLNTNKVPNDRPEDFRRIPFVLASSLSEPKKKMMELEENWRRKTMSWQENVLGLFEFHKAATYASYSDGERWSQELTARLLGVSQSKLSVAISIAEFMRKYPGHPIHKADNVNDALTIMTKVKLDEATKIRAARFEAQAAEDDKLAENEPGLTQGDQAVQSGTKLVRPAMINQAPRQDGAPLLETTEVISKRALSKFYTIGDSLVLMQDCISNGKKFNHIITDPPYGIDMANLDSSNSIDRVEETHQVKANVELFSKFFKLAFDILYEDGFLLMWYDLDHHEKLQALAIDAGFKACRWPIVWCKSSPCSNSMAQYNPTKATEVCLVLRKSSSSTLRKKGLKNWFVCSSDSSATHPFVKPYDLWEHLIELVSDEQQTILDPFAGQGSSLYSMFKLNRIPTGFEIDERHANLGVDFMHERLNVSANPLQGLV